MSVSDDPADPADPRLTLAVDRQRLPGVRL